jgi:hypothetical protein
MNERIVELAREADLDLQLQSLRVEKFAKLLVAECASVCEEIAEMAEITNTGEVGRKTKATAASCSNFIKNRFGVK